MIEGVALPPLALFIPCFFVELCNFLRPNEEIERKISPKIIFLGEAKFLPWEYPTLASNINIEDPRRSQRLDDRWFQGFLSVFGPFR